MAEGSIKLYDAGVAASRKNKRRPPNSPEMSGKHIKSGPKDFHQDLGTLRRASTRSP